MKSCFHEKLKVEVEDMIERVFVREQPIINDDFEEYLYLRYRSKFRSNYEPNTTQQTIMVIPKHVQINGDYTTVVWTDGTSTVVKKMKGEKNDPEKAILFAIMKKIFNGNKANLDRYLSEFEDKTIIKEKKDKKKRGK